MSGVGTQLADHGIGIVCQPHHPQPTSVAENEAVPVGEVKNRPGVAVNLFRVQEQNAGHPEMYNQRSAIRQVKDEILSPTFQAFYLLSD
jgi:hypothetical protein